MPGGRKSGTARSQTSEPSTQDPIIPISPSSKPEDKPEKKTRAKPLKWEDHPSWTERAIQHLIENPRFRIRLFSDSTSNAKEQNRKKIQASEAKNILYGELAAIIFTDDPDPDVRKDYEADRMKYGRSTQQQFSR